MKPLRVGALLLLFVATRLLADDRAIRDAARLIERGDVRKAESDLTALLKREPRNARAHELLGDVYRKGGRNGPAETEYRLALSNGARSAELLKNLATVQKRSRRFSEARGSYEKALELSPSDREARTDLDALRRRRGVSLFGAVGGWETDSTTRGWEAELFYGGLDRFDPFVATSYADKYFYTRRSVSGKVYGFYSPTGSVKLAASRKTYEYPVAINPVPDANAYGAVPSVEVEISDDLSSSVRASLAYEYFRPDFFYAPGTTAQNHKVSAEVAISLPATPLRLRILSAFLRDPDPEKTIVNRAARTAEIVYGSQFLLGGGVGLSLPKLTGELLVLPNRDLDRSTDISVLVGVTVPLPSSFSVGAGYLFDHYSSTSPFSGQTAQLATATVTFTGWAWADVSGGVKVVRRPVRDDSGVFVTARFKLSVR
jgi:tetratricopeptide (TPR) repeat protein